MRARRLFSRLSVALVLFLFSNVNAGQNSENLPDHTKQDPVWTGDFGSTFVSAYFAFGVMQENKGLIAEPYFDISRNLFTGNGWINNITLGLQLWSSTHSAETGASKTTAVPWWYEFDYYVPVGITIAKKWTVTTSYLDYEFPGEAFTAQRGIQLNVAYDDSKLLGSFALHPHALILYNFDGVLGVGRTKAWYGELGVAPAFTIGSKSSYPIGLSFPLLIGFADDRFYPGDPYGYFSASVNAGVPISCLPKSVGSWIANVGFTYYNLGKATTSVNVNRDPNAFVWQIGAGRNF